MWSELLIGTISIPVGFFSIYQLGKCSARWSLNNNLKHLNKHKELYEKEIKEHNEALKQLDNLVCFSY
jgi:hypothetical protein